MEKKDKLTIEQESNFWNLVKAEIKKDKAFSSLVVWDSSDVNSLLSKMAKKLTPLCAEKKRVSNLCKFENFISADGKYSMFQTANDILNKPIVDIKQAPTKNRFTYFLFDKSFDEFVKEHKEIILGAASLAPHHSASDVPFLFRQLYNHIDTLIFNASQVKGKLKKHYRFVEVEEFLDLFEELHKDHIKSLRQGNFNLANKQYLKIYDLSKEMQFQEMDNNPNKTFFDTLGPALYFRDPSPGVLMDLYTSELKEENS